MDSLGCRRDPAIHGMLLSAILFLLVGAFVGFPRGPFELLAFIPLLVLCSLGAVIGDFTTAVIADACFGGSWEHAVSDRFSQLQFPAYRNTM